MAWTLKREEPQGPVEVMDTPDKWVGATLDLIKITQNGRLRWERKGNLTGQDIFEARIGGKTLSLMTQPPPTPGGLLLVDSQHRRQISLFILDDGGKYLSAFPVISPLEALENAVRAQVEQAEDAFLGEIRKAAASVG